MNGHACQSCGMPLNETEMLGTEANGTKTDTYCMYCYEGGEFKQPELTMEQMIEICVPFMKENGIAEGEARTMLQNQLPSLKRWNN